MPLNPPKRSKNVSIQSFSKEDLCKWQRQLETGCEYDEVTSLFLDVFQAATQKDQLTAIKTIGSSLKSHSLTSGCVNTALCVLVELHSMCASRHPLQRAISSLLQSQCESRQLVVMDSITRCIGSMLTVSSEQVNDEKQLKAMHYIEILMENFGVGQHALESELPTMLEFCVAMLGHYKGTEQDNSNAINVLIALLKTVTSLLLKLSQPVYLMLTLGKVEGEHWPAELKCSEDKKQWARDKVTELTTSSEAILVNSGSIPHDATVSAAMLLVSTLNINIQLQPSQKTLLDKFIHCQSTYSAFAQLSLCHAYLAKLPQSLLASMSVEGQPLLVALFQLINKLSASFTESSERYIASRTLTLWTNVARECAGDIDEESPLNTALLPSGSIVQTLLQYIWSLWEDPIDGIRHQCRSMFENIIKTYKQLYHSSEDFLLELTETLVSLESPTRGQFVLLSSLCSHVPADRILHTAPHLPSQLMAVMGHQALACHAGELWGRLVSSHWTVASGKEELVWSNTWIEPLITTMCTGDQLAMKHITQHCLPALFQCCAKALDLVTAQMDKMTHNVQSSQLLTARLACLRCAKAQLRDGLSDTHSLEDLFSNAMYHADEQVRLSALGLVCESHRTTEPPQPSHLPLLLTFVELNANSQSPGFRYPVLTCFKKLFIRIRDSCYSMSKAFQKSKGLTENPATLIAKFKEFLSSLLEQQFSALHPLSSFQRRNFSLSLLQTVVAIFTGGQQETSTEIPPVFEFRAAVSIEQARCLVDGLRDPFDANKLLCLQLLYALEPENIGLGDSEYLTHCVLSFERLVSSPKSVNCTSAAYLLKLLTNFVCGKLNTNLSKSLNQEGTCTDGIAPPSEDDPLFCTLKLLCELLRQHIHSARADLVGASITSPMYGLLQSIRTIVEAIHWRPSVPSQEMIQKVVWLCIEVSEVVSPVVCSSSPEGFLPDSTECVAADTARLSLCDEGPHSMSGTAQSLLLCCWHSMKEISLLLGYLVGELGEASGDKGILSQDQLEKISDLFIHQLTEARHRGAFEMAYTGFCKLCRCLWSSSSPTLSKKPSVWIHDLLDSLQTSSLVKLLSVTRRSAGLPFYVQAILTSEPSYTGYSCSKYTLQTLLKVAKAGLCSEATSAPSEQPAAVHALNILRSLYRESKLGDFVVPFIPEGIMIAIGGFSASLWPIRNSSTLLFSALVSRVFGAKRVQDEHSVENKMTSREFFTRFPTLYSFLLEQLQKSATQLLDSDGKVLQPSLFPTLLLLSRLYPSPLDEEHSPITTRPFITHLISCTRCPVWKTRVLVSCTLASLTASSNIAPLLQLLYARMCLSDQNSLHGSLLVVSVLLREREKQLLTCSTEAGPQSLACWLLGEHLNKIYIATSDNPCGLTAQLYLDVLYSLLELGLKKGTLSSLDQHGKESLRALLSIALEYCINLQTKQWTLFHSALYSSYFSLLLLVADHSTDFTQVLKLSPVIALSDLLCKGLTSRNCLSTATLKFINSLASSDPRYKDLCELIHPLTVQLVQVEKDPEILAQAFLFLATHYTSRSDTEDKVFTLAYHLCLQPSNTLELRLSLMQFITHTLSLFSANQPPSRHYSQYVVDWVCHLKDLSVPTQPYEIRVCVAEQLHRLWGLSVLCPYSHEPLCTLIVTLLTDSDEDVRTQAAATVTRIIPKSVIPHVECLNPSQALRLFIHHCLTSYLTLNILFSLLSLASQDEHTLLSTLTTHTVASSITSQPTLHQSNTPSHPANLLFDEDPINDYAEDILVLRLVVKALESIRPQLSHDHLRQVTEVLRGLTQESVLEDRSPWESVSAFKAAMRLRLLAPLIDSMSI